MTKIEIWDQGQLLAMGTLCGFTGTMDGTAAVVMRDDGWLMSVDVRACKVIQDEAAADRQAQLEKDAERYRFIRGAQFGDVTTVKIAFSNFSGDKFDTEIDAAIAAAKQTEKQNG